MSRRQQQQQQQQRDSGGSASSRNSGSGGGSSDGVSEGSSEEECVYQALYDYQAAVEGDLSFSEGDTIMVVGPRVGTWWLACNTRTNRQGYIPHNFIKKRLSMDDTGASSLVEVLTVQYDYKTTSPDALTLRRSQQVEVVGDGGPGWVRVRVLGTTTEGLVPRAYLTQDHHLVMEEWYHGAVSRKAAETMLKSEANFHEGTFLVRGSSQAMSGYCISVVNNGLVSHYLIYLTPEGSLRLTKRDSFPSLTALVDHYRTNSDLNTCLTTPAKKDAPPPTPPPANESSNEVVDEGVGRTENPWEVDRGCLQEVGETLGEGQFGRVYKAYWNTSILVAVKAIKDDCMKRTEFLREGETMRRLRHPRLVKLYGVVSKPESQPLLLLTELLPGGSLLHHLHALNSKGTPHSHGVLAKMGAQVASGMAYLESEKVIHRDLAARNILVADNLSVKIADFGLARFIKDDFYLRRSNVKFPVKWTSPESLVHNIYTSKSDVWSFGILLYELFTHGGSPYTGLSNKEARHSIQDGELNRCPPDCPPTVYSMMLDCWRANPTDRPSFSIILPTITSISDSFITQSDRKTKK
ncbi:hypothetical protein Pcinc_020189 [Petrolisthes cinctipes]|uniref:Tyrosine-protein kinase n=1 Tax=Petrolisthes cinctipes TaxID=88211 RepID=A0AAE1KJC0_PETCI|nr:hypothetical protein Pcinc_020189 [Petrolisthes cinctipes]